MASKNFFVTADLVRGQATNRTAGDGSNLRQYQNEWIAFKDVDVQGADHEKSPLTYQFLTFGISPRNMTYQPGIWHISVVWHISQDFDISVRILYRLPLQYKPFCTVFHCSTKPGVFASGTWESHSVPSFTPPPTKLLPFSQTTTRAVTPVAVGRRPLYARQD